MHKAAGTCQYLPGPQAATNRAARLGYPAGFNAISSKSFVSLPTSLPPTFSHLAILRYYIPALDLLVIVCLKPDSYSVTMFLGAKKPQIIRKVTAVPVPPPKDNIPQERPPSKGKNSKPPPRPSHANVRTAKQGERNGHLTPPPSVLKRNNKRKAPSPAVQQFSSSSEDESDEKEDITIRKRTRYDTLVPDLKRQVRDILDWQHEDGNKHPIIHGIDLTRGKTKEFKAAFAQDGDAEHHLTVELQYPSSCPPER